MTTIEILDALGAPAWVRRCAAMNHKITYKSFEMVERWFCRTCGKDRP